MTDAERYAECCIMARNDERQARQAAEARVKELESMLSEPRRQAFALYEAEQAVLVAAKNAVIDGVAPFGMISAVENLKKAILQFH